MNTFSFKSIKSNNMNNIAQPQRPVCNIAERQATLLNRASSFFKDLGRNLSSLGGNVRNLVNKFVRNLDFACTFMFTYVVALVSALLLLGVLFWGVYTFVPAFFWDHFGKLAERTGLDEAIMILNGVPMLYQDLAALLVVCLCYRVGRPYCAAVLSIHNLLMKKDYGSVKNVLSGVKDHTNGISYEYSGFILKCAVAAAVVCIILKAAHVM